MEQENKLKVILLQIKLLLKKNILVAYRSWLSTLLELLSPVFFIVVLLIITKAPTPAANTIITNQSQSLPQCIAYSEGRCFNLLFSPISSPITVELMKLIGELNDPPIPYIEVTDYSLNSSQNIIGGIIGFEDTLQIMDFIQLHPNITQGGIEVLSIPLNFSYINYNDPLYNAKYPAFEYNIIWNSTCPSFFGGCADYMLPINIVLQKAINNFQVKNSNITGKNPQMVISTTSYPVYEGSQNPNGCLFFYCGSMISFIFVLYKISYEKEKKLRQGMVMMGLTGVSYWVSWFITCLLTNLLITFITIAIGAICQFAFFTSTNFFVNFFLFFLYTTSMTAIAFFICTFIGTTKAAIGVGMAVFIIGAVLQMIFSLLGQLIFQLLYETDNTPALVARIFLSVLPMFHFSKAITDINAFALTYPYSGVGFNWSDLKLNLNSPAAANVIIPETYLSLVYMVVLIFGYLFLAWYFEHVIPGNDGNTEPPYFFLLPSYWGISKKQAKFLQAPQTNDTDINESTNRANDPNNKSPLIIRGLSKLYRPNIFNSKKNVQAVKYLSISAEVGSVTALLGHNGCGKSTTIGMLTGLIAPTTGDALIFGHSVINDIHKIRKLTSVCPQHDIVWNELTVKEHLELFSELKNIPIEERVVAIERQLSAVRLKKLENNRVSDLSGGQRRRLSVGISCIGNPKIIFLDEATTGTDPKSRRHIWNLIKEIKKDKVIILTSHLMEEVEILADKIAIMSHGQLMAYGNSLQLKNRYSDGYSINIIASSIESIPQVKDFILKSLPNSKVLGESATFLSFGFPVHTSTEILVPFFQSLEKISKSENPMFRDFGVSHSTLDEVFIKVTKLKTN